MTSGLMADENNAMKINFTLYSLLLLLPAMATAQFSKKLSSKVSVSVDENIETYFIAEKLAVEHIGNYVFSNRDQHYDHQPMVYHAFQHFKPWKDSPVILRISKILEKIKPILNDNAQVLEYLLYRNTFPKTGLKWELPKTLSVFDAQKYPEASELAIELADSLASFYKQAEVGKFLRENKAYYKGAMAEAIRYINVKSIPFEEKGYGQTFAGYAFYLMPGMPITYGEDNYRAFGSMLSTPKGMVATMVFSTSVMVPLKQKLNDYKSFGFDNQQVVSFLTVHELGHSFVNPLLTKFKKEIGADTSLFTEKLRKRLEKSYIESWETCLIEHLVRLGEIRIAKAMGNHVEENRLRKMHVNESGFVLLPFLEKVIVEYETKRDKFPDLNSFLPTLFNKIHALNPQDIDKLVVETPF